MLTKAMKYVSIAALILAALVWNDSHANRVALRFIVSLGAFLVALQAARARKYRWSAAFYGVLVFFNPFVGAGLFSNKVSLAVVLGAMVLFAASLRSLTTQPLLSIPSITGRTPGSVSL